MIQSDSFINSKLSLHNGETPSELQIADVLKEGAKKGSSNSMLGLTIGSLAISAASALYNAYQSKKTSDRNYEMQKQTNAQNMYLNTHQQQISSADALKAGINPLAMNGSSMNSVGYDNVSQPTLDTSQLSDALSTLLNAQVSMKNNESTNQVTKEINESNNQTALDIARMNNATQRSIISQQINNDVYKWDNPSGNVKVTDATERAKLQFAKDNANVVNEIDKISANAQKLLSEASWSQAQTASARQLMDDFNSVYQNAYLATQDEALKQEMQIAYGEFALKSREFEEALKNKNFDKAMDIWSSINDSIFSIGSIFSPIKLNLGKGKGSKK